MGGGRVIRRLRSLGRVATCGISSMEKWWRLDESVRGGERELGLE